VWRRFLQELEEDRKAASPFKTAYGRFKGIFASLQGDNRPTGLIERLLTKQSKLRP